MAPLFTLTLQLKPSSKRKHLQMWSTLQIIQWQIRITITSRIHELYQNRATQLDRKGWGLLHFSNSGQERMGIVAFLQFSNGGHEYTLLIHASTPMENSPL
jgi:hypothetical protein